MKYLRKFATEADGIGVDLEKPNVVLIKDTGEVLYNARIYANGVYIQHINGDLYTAEQWASFGYALEQANGIAVKADTRSFVIAKTYQPSSIWSNNAVELDGVETAATKVEAYNDYNGAKNTQSLLLTGESGIAAASAANYVFPNGERGYLPSVGEWDEVHQWRTEVDAAFAVMGGNALSAFDYWTSTQQSSSLAWSYHWTKGDSFTNLKTTKMSLRAFAPLNI